MNRSVWIGVGVFLNGTRLCLASGEAEGAISPFAGDIGNALWTVVIFVLVVLVLGRFAWGPILRALQKREEFIHDALLQAKKDRAHAEATLKAYTEKLEAARVEASAIVEEGRRDADVLKRAIEETGRNEAVAMIERARREIRIATETATKELYSLGGRLATDVAARIIRKELSAAEHERLITEALEELRSTGVNGKF